MNITYTAKSGTTFIPPFQEGYCDCDKKCSKCGKPKRPVYPMIYN